MLAKMSKTSANSSTARIRRPTIGLTRVGIDGGRLAVPLVVTVTVNGRAVPLVTERLEGTWQAAPKGTPLQANEILPVKPGPGLTCNWYLRFVPRRRKLLMILLEQVLR
jgi:hypothetical protein